MNIRKVWTFASESNPKNTYETLQYIDGSTSCNCRGWTMKKVGQERTCRHTRLVDQGIADTQCISNKVYQSPAPKSMTGLNPLDALASTLTGPKKVPKAKPVKQKGSEPLVQKEEKISSKPLPAVRGRKIELW